MFIFSIFSLFVLFGVFKDLRKLHPCFHVLEYALFFKILKYNSILVCFFNLFRYTKVHKTG